MLFARSHMMRISCIRCFAASDSDALGVSSGTRARAVWGLAMQDADVCAICQESVSSDAGGVCLHGCGHRFHGHCVVPWLQRNRSCPLCRNELHDSDESNDETDDGEAHLRAAEDRRLFQVGMRAITSRFAARHMKVLRIEYESTLRRATRATDALILANRALFTAEDAGLMEHPDRARLVSDRVRRLGRREMFCLRRLGAVRRRVEAIGSRHRRFTEGSPRPLHGRVDH